jgi:hypothetical protein
MATTVWHSDERLRGRVRAASSRWPAQVPDTSRGHYVDTPCVDKAPTARPVGKTPWAPADDTRNHLHGRAYERSHVTGNEHFFNHRDGDTISR